MSMSVSVWGIIPNDEKWQKMKKIYDACEDSGIEPPKEVSDYFDYSAPDPIGRLIDLTEEPNKCVMKIGEVDGFEVDLSLVPEHVKIIRFENSW